MTFVVAPATRIPNSGAPNNISVDWPIVFENPTTGYNTQPIATFVTRAAAQSTADALNAVLVPGSSAATSTPIVPPASTSTPASVPAP